MDLLGLRWLWRPCGIAGRLLLVGANSCHPLGTVLLEAILGCLTRLQRRQNLSMERLILRCQLVESVQGVEDLRVAALSLHHNV